MEGKHVFIKGFNQSFIGKGNHYAAKRQPDTRQQNKLKKKGPKDFTALFLCEINVS